MTTRKEAGLGEAIELICREMRWCFSSRPLRRSLHAAERAAYIGAIRSYIRSLRALRSIEAAENDAAIEAEYPHSGGL